MPTNHIRIHILFKKKIIDLLRVWASFSEVFLIDVWFSIGTNPSTHWVHLFHAVHVLQPSIALEQFRQPVLNFERTFGG